MREGGVAVNETQGTVKATTGPAERASAGLSSPEEEAGLRLPLLPPPPPPKQLHTLYSVSGTGTRPQSPGPLSGIPDSECHSIPHN